jgi:hypothetical protein
MNSFNNLSGEIVKYVLADMLCDKDKLSLFSLDKRYRSYTNDIYLNEKIYTRILSNFKIRKYKIFSDWYPIPDYVKDLIINTSGFFGESIDKFLKERPFPSKLESLHLFNYTRPIASNALSSRNIHKLVLYDYIHPLVHNILPENLQELLLIGESNYHHILLPGIFPSNLHTLKFIQGISQPLDINVLPKSLHTLEFSIGFNQLLISGLLPPNLHTLNLGYSWNKPLKKGDLPNTLHTLKFGYWFNNPIDEDVLPPNLHTLHLGRLFNQPLNRQNLPSTLKVLKFPFDNIFEHSLHKDNFPLPITIHRGASILYLQ